MTERQRVTEIRDFQFSDGTNFFKLLHWVQQAFKHHNSDIRYLPTTTGTYPDICLNLRANMTPSWPCNSRHSDRTVSCTCEQRQTLTIENNTWHSEMRALGVDQRTSNKSGSGCPQSLHFSVNGKKERGAIISVPLESTHVLLLHH